MKKHLKLMTLLLSMAFLVLGCKPEDEKKHEYVLDASGSYNGYGYVDLDLPSGTLWAVCNVGANSPMEYGDYFAWGETRNKEYYHWNTYAFSQGDYTQLTKYCDSVSYGFDGFTDELTVLLPEDDPATVNWGDGWRTPTVDDWEELWFRGGLVSDVATVNGVHGLLFTSWNGNMLFLPCAGYRLGSQLYDEGMEDCYWSNSLDTITPFRSIIQHYLIGYGGGMNSRRRCEGLPVRAVCSSPRK